MAVRLRPSALVFVLLAGGCAATAPPSPYAGQEENAIKALSPKETADFLSGAGMGYAKAAELNGYPGPSHVLALATPLGLTASQRAAVESILATHKAEARSLGQEVVKLEQQLDALFAKQRATPEGIDAIAMQLAATTAGLRASHLKAHVTTTRLLTQGQVAQYVELRGYGSHSAH